MTTEQIIALEEAHQIPTYKKMPVALVQGEGCRVWDADGNVYYDFYGGHCVSILGHSPRRVVEALKHQAGELLFYSNVVYSPVRARAAAALARMAPDGMGHLFFCNSGTEANETALKMARTWTGKTGIVATRAGFHGRTLGSLATTWAEKYRAPFKSVLADTHFVPFGDAEALAQVLEAHDDIAAFILEPLQSLGGVTEAPDAYYRALRDICDQHQVALIFDEVQTGVGRTGTFSISEQFGITPDLITMAKSLGAGMPVGATFASDAIAETVQYGDQGSTFGGGMLAMAAVEAVVQTLEEDHLMERAQAIHQRIREGLTPMVKAIRGRGCLIGVELDSPAAPVLAGLRAEGILAGGAVPDTVIRLMPPLNTPDDAIDALLEAFDTVLSTPAHTS